jgi:hypothetical protein
MNKPMIENTDRGITLNKSLAWTVLVTLVGGGFWVGVQVTDLASGLSILENRQGEDRAAIRDNAAAVNGLRQSNARIDERLISIERSSQRTEESVNEVLRFLRQFDGPRQ